MESINLNVTDIDNGDWVAVSNVDFGANGATSFKANVAATIGGKIEIRLDSPQGDLIGTLDIKPTGGEQQWEEKQCDIDVEKAKGVHSIFFVFTGSNASNLFNIDYWQFTKAPGTTAVTGVTLNANTLSLEQDDSALITATVTPSNATINTVTWSSSNPTVATVDNAGKVTAKAAGKATITATTVDGGFAATCAVTVEPGQTLGVEVTGVSLNKNTATVRVNKTTQLIATITPENATNKAVTWSSSDETVATVDQTGTVTAVKSGNAVISVKTVDSGYIATCNVTVEETPEEPEIPELTVKEIKEIKVDTIVGTAPKLPAQVEVIYSDASTKKVSVTWDIITKDQYAKVGIFAVEGAVHGEKFKARATVTVKKKPSSGGDSSSSGGSSSSSGSTTKPTEPTKPIEPAKPTEIENEDKDTTQPVKVTISLLKGTASSVAGNIELFVKPYIQDGRTMTGIRDIAVLLGIESENIIWDGKTKTVLVKTGNKKIKFTINEKHVFVNGEKIMLDVAPQIKDGRAVLPIAHLARILGNELQFDSETKEVILIANQTKE